MSDKVAAKHIRARLDRVIMEGHIGGAASGARSSRRKTEASP